MNYAVIILNYQSCDAYVFTLFWDNKKTNWRGIKITLTCFTCRCSCSQMLFSLEYNICWYFNYWVLNLIA
jgi:hypothetical protein